MSATISSRNGKKDDTNKSSGRVDVGLGDKPLYFKNAGLFSENFLLHHLPASKDPFVLKNWATEGEFDELYEWMLSTWREKREEFETNKEAQLEEEWIKPILQRLGWEYVVQPDLTKHGKRQIPDYALFESAAAKKKANGSDERKFFEISSLVADAKAMKIDLDGDSQDNSNPSYQIIQYMSYTGKEWGILTNGKYWRLYSLKSKTKYRAYFEVNVEKFLNGDTREDARFKYFFNFFRREAFQRQEGKSTFVDYVFSDGEQYALEVEEELKTRAFELVEKICVGFAAGRGELSEQELTKIYNHSLYYLFRLIFVLNCEAKGLLNVSRQSDYYPYSLRCIALRLKEEIAANQKWSKQPVSYSHVSSLFELLGSGDKNIGIHGFGNEVFSSGDKSFYKEYSIPDSVLNDVIVNLACRYEKKAKDWKFIDYERLNIDHLGSLFEGLLEFRLSQSGSKVELLNSSGERKASGSYYTPDYIVDYVVSETLSPVVKAKSLEEILKLKVYDPTMGSGHFLLGAVKFLEDAILEKSSGGAACSIPIDTISREILKKCIVGTDLNPLAVELAKFSLWIFTLKRDQSVEGLGKQLMCQDSLIPYSSEYQEGFKEDVKADCIVGNPPWDKVRFDDEEFFKEFIGTVGGKKQSKEKKREIYDRLLAKPEIAKLYKERKGAVERRLRAIDTNYYEYQVPDSDKQSRHIDHNLYKLAVERFFRALNKGGRVGLVMPTGILGDLGCVSLRKFMFKKNQIDRIVGFKETAKLFDITQAVSLLIGTSGGVTKEFQYVDNLGKDDFNRLCNGKLKFPKIKWSLVEKLDADTLTIPYFESDFGVSLVEKMQDLVARHGQFNFDFGRELHQTDDAKNLASAKNSYPVFKGDEIDHFVVRTSAKQYLNAQGQKKYQTRISSSPKVAIRAISGLTLSRRLIACVLPPKCLSVNSLLVLKNEVDENEMKFLVGFLNCRSSEFRFRLISKNNNINKFALSMLPIPKFSAKNRLHEQIVKIVDGILDDGPTPGALADLEARIEQVYGFNKDESSYLHEAIPAIGEKKVAVKKAA